MKENLENLKEGIKGILPIVFVAAAVFLASYLLIDREDTWICSDGQWVRHGSPYAPMPTEPCAKTTRGASTASREAFDETGHIIFDNPGFKRDVLYLSYEKPGAAALAVELLFDSRSVCSANGRAGACPDILLLQSSLTRVKGVRSGDVVRVTEAVAGATR